MKDKIKIKTYPTLFSWNDNHKVKSFFKIFFVNLEKKNISHQEETYFLFFSFPLLSLPFYSANKDYTGIVQSLDYRGSYSKVVDI